jgi:hypothetical protein
VTVTAETAAVATAPSTVTETIEIDLAGKYRGHRTPNKSCPLVIEIEARSTAAACNKPVVRPRFTNSIIYMCVFDFRQAQVCVLNCGASFLRCFLFSPQKEFTKA